MKPIVLDLKPSIYLLTVFVGIGGLALLCLWLSPLHWAWQFSMSLIVSALTLHAVFHHALLKAGQSVRQVRVTEKGECWLLRRNGEQQQISLTFDSVVHPLLTTLCSKSGFFCANAILLVPDNVNPEAFRALRVWLMWGKP